jgi:L-ornithine N5-oxygenase
VQIRETDVFGVVGVGFGPSNLALAVALDESSRSRSEGPMGAMFLEREASFNWHRGMLLPSAKMQVSFLKDLATFRNPTSRFSFVSYLHDRGRLAKFVNNQDFFPTRQEYHDYLEWAGSRISSPVAYGLEVTAVRLPPRPDRDAPIDHLRVEAQAVGPGGGRKTFNARNVVISTGLRPWLPAGVEPADDIWHSGEFLYRFGACDRARLRRVAVVGAGQSAAEIVRFLYDALPHATITAVLPSYGFSIADDTPFANEVFDPVAVDHFYHGSPRAKEAIWHYHKNTNYSVADDEVIRDLYQRYYDEDVKGSTRLSFLNLSRVVGVKRVGDDTRITVDSLASEESHHIHVDVLVCATGYDPMDPGDLLGELDDYCLRDEDGRYRVGRDYSISTHEQLQSGIYLQGGTEQSHGLSSSLLSNIAVRSGEIVDSMFDRLTSAGPP